MLNLNIKVEKVLVVDINKLPEDNHYEYELVLNSELRFKDKAEANKIKDKIIKAININKEE